MELRVLKLELEKMVELAKIAAMDNSKVSVSNTT
jgi:hypothetical protein